MATNSYEQTEIAEKEDSMSNTQTTSSMTLQQAVEFGEYKPEFLSTFPE